MVAMTTTYDRLLAACADAWTPKTHGPTSQWISENVRLNPEYEADSGRYDATNNPWWEEIINAFHARDVFSISLLKSTQIGGTLSLIVTLIATSEIDPAPGILVLPTQDEARIVRDRVYANCEVSSSAVARRVPSERNRNLISIDLMTCQTYLAWAGSKQRLRGKPCKYVWLSEIDVYESGGEAGDQTRAVERRTDQFAEHTVVRESTPVGDESPIANYYDASDQRQWWCACPHCGRRQVVRFIFHRNPKLDWLTCNNL